MDYQALIKKIKKRRAILLTVSIIAVILLALGSMELSHWVNGESVTYYKGILPTSTAVLLLVIVLFVVFFVSILSEAKIAEIYNKQCRPEAYLAVKVALCSKRKQESEPMRYAKMIVANALGDYANCESYARTLSATKNINIRLGVLGCMQDVYFERGSIIECEGILHSLDALLAQTTKDGVRKRIEESRAICLLALCLLRGEREEAVRMADSLTAPTETVGEVGRAYYQGLAYLTAEGRAEDALYAFLTVQKKGGSLCYVQKSLPMLEEARARLSKK